MKNHCVALIKLCMMGGGGVGDKKWCGYTSGAVDYASKISNGDNYNLITVIGWRLRDDIDPIIMRLINGPWGNQILAFPSEGSMSLAEGMKEVEWRRREGRECLGQDELGLGGVGYQGAVENKSYK